MCSLSTFDPQLSAVAERLAMYEGAVRAAKDKGDSTKVRRYTRAMETIRTIQRRVCRCIYMYIKPSYDVHVCTTYYKMATIQLFIDCTNVVSL